MVERDNFFRWLQGVPEPTEEELKLLRRMWSASTAVAMYHEFSSIIISRMAYIVMRPQRFVFNLGYTAAGADSAGMTSVGLLFTSMFVELCFEFVVDTVALQAESAHGEDDRERMGLRTFVSCVSTLIRQENPHRHSHFNILDHVAEEP